MRVIAIALTTTALAAALPAAAGAVPTVVDPVLRTGDLRGWAPGQPVVRQGPVAFAAAHDTTARALRRRGFVAGATGLLGGPSRGFGLSIVTRWSSEAAAAREGARLTAANVGPDEGLAARPLPVPGVPEAAAVVLTGARGGVRYAGVSAVVVRGRLVIELFVLAPRGAAPAGRVAEAIRRGWARAA